MNLFKSRSARSDGAALQWRSPILINPESYDPVFYAEMLRLHRFHVCSRWIVVATLWFVLGGLSLWRLKPELTIITQYFTWPALRYGLAFHPVASLGLAICLGPTLGLLLWQSRNVLLGLPKHDLKRLEDATQKVRQQGKSHPLWNLICKPSQKLDSKTTMQADAPPHDNVHEDFPGSDESDRGSELRS